MAIATGIFRKSCLVLLGSSLCSLGAFASEPTAKEACRNLEEMLMETHLNQPAYNEIEFALLDKVLKTTFTLRCEGRVQAGRDTGGHGEDPVDEKNFTNGQVMFDRGEWHLPNGRMFKPLSFLGYYAGESARILQPFLDAHRSCAPGCGYVSWGIWGDEAHQRRRSCHNSGEAIDVHAITCGGTHAAPSQRFNRYVSCMRGHLGVIYGSGSHNNHAHFQLHGCSMCQGKNCGGESGNDDGDEEEEGE